MRKNSDGTVTVKIRETGQVIDMVPDVARAMIESKYAVEMNPEPATPINLAIPHTETAVAPPIAERADAPPQGSIATKIVNAFRNKKDKPARKQRGKNR
jgi:hypothetical protein